jgi:hypothetical protein
MEYLGLYNRSKAEVHPGNKLTGPIQEEDEEREEDEEEGVGLRPLTCLIVGSNPTRSMDVCLL